MTSLRQRLGATALISHRTNPAGVAGALVEPVRAGGPLVYLLDGARGALPAAGDAVHCWSDEAGGWASTVREVRPDALVLDRPAWLVRQASRRSVRVESSVTVRLQLRGLDVAGRLVDVSTHGAGLLLEGTLAPAAGVEVAVELPQGDQVRGVVRSRRVHSHRLLRVVGLQWVDGDDRGRTWLDGEVARALARRGHPREA